MVKKVYISNMVFDWTIDRQKATLAAVIDKYSVYEDHLSQAARKQKRLAALKQREVMFTSVRPGEGDEVHVASWTCLAFDLDDLIRVAAQGTRRGFAIVVHDIDSRLEPGASADEIERVKSILRWGRVTAGSSKGRKEAAARKIADTLRRIEIARPHWHLRELSTDQIRALAHDTNKKPMARATLHAHLGDRVEAQEAHDRKVAREADRLAARERRAKGIKA